MRCCATSRRATSLAHNLLATSSRHAARYRALDAAQSAGDQSAAREAHCIKGAWSAGGVGPRRRRVESAARDAASPLQSSAALHEGLAALLAGTRRCVRDERARDPC